MKALKKVILFGSAALAATCVAVGVGVSENRMAALAEDATISDFSVQEYYFIGESLQLPKTVQVAVGGQTYEGTYAGTVEPNGYVNAQGELALQKLGEYEAVYSYTLGGKSYTVSEAFNVLNKNWVVGSEKSTVTYGAVSTNELTATGATGLTINLAAGDTFTYQEPINLNSQDLTDVITFQSNAIRAKYEMVHYGTGEMVAEVIEVTMTDCYDPSISVTGIMFMAPEVGSGTYARTRATGQGEYGLYLECPPKLNKPDVYIDGLRYGVYAGDYGQTLSTIVSGTYFKWSFSATDGKVYLTGGNYKYNNSFMINQVTNTQISGKAFPGFTTGEVYVSVTALDTYKDSTTIEIEAIGEKRGEQLVESGVVDTLAPSLIVHSPSADKGFYVKKGEPFKVFSATAYDPNLVGEVNAAVYCNYGTAMQSSVLLKDGVFTPTQIGVYTIEYSAKDAYGNKAVKTVNVLSCEEDVTVLQVDELEGMTAGVRTYLPTPTVTSLNGAVNTSVKVTFEDGTEYQVRDDGSVTPISVGKYTVTYAYSDCLKDYEYSYEIECERNEGYTFLDEVVSEPYYIKDVAYTLPKLNAYQYTGKEPTPAACDVFVSYNGGEYTPVENTDAYVISQAGTVRFKYAVEGVSYETEAVEIVDVDYYGDLDIAAYFKGDFTATKSYEYIDFAFDKGTGEQTLGFVRPLAYSIFSLTYTLPQSGMNFGSYSVILTDLADSDNRVWLHFADVGGILYVTINGGDPIVVGGNLADGVERQIRYSEDSKTFYFYTPKATYSTLFDIGFESDYCTMQVVLHDVARPSTIRIQRIQNQLICADAFDDYDPQIYLRKGAGYVTKNTEGVVSAAVVSDVLSPVLAEKTLVTVTVDGKAVTAKDGTLLKDVRADRDYEIVFSEFGRYRVVYTAEDESSNDATQFYIVEVADMTAPTISLDGVTADTVQQVKVGYKYDVKPYTVSDNYSNAEKITVYVYVYTENGVLTVYNQRQFTLMQEGKYVVYLYAVDEAGNYSTASYQLLAVK